MEPEGGSKVFDFSKAARDKAGGGRGARRLVICFKSLAIKALSRWGRKNSGRTLA